MTTARLEVLAGDPTRAVAGEKQGYIGDIFGRADALERRKARAIFAILVWQHVYAPGAGPAGQSEMNTAIALATVYKALGGGWQK